MKTLFPLLIAGMLVAVVAYRTGVRATQHTQAPAMAEFQDVRWLKTELSLTDSQEEAIRDLGTAYRAQLAALCEKHCAARNELAEHLLQGTSERETEQRLLDEMARVQVETDAVTLEQIRHIRRVLTADQQVQYDQFITEHLQTACPHHLHHATLTHGDCPH